MAASVRPLPPTKTSKARPPKDHRAPTRRWAAHCPGPALTGCGSAPKAQVRQTAAKPRASTSTHSASAAPVPVPTAVDVTTNLADRDRRAFGFPPQGDHPQDGARREFVVHTLKEDRHEGHQHGCRGLLLGGRLEQRQGDQHRLRQGQRPAGTDPVVRHPSRAPSNAVLGQHRGQPGRGRSSPRRGHRADGPAPPTTSSSMPPRPGRWATACCSPPRPDRARPSSARRRSLALAAGQKCFYPRSRRCPGQVRRLIERSCSQQGRAAHQGTTRSQQRADRRDDHRGAATYSTPAAPPCTGSATWSWTRCTTWPTRSAAPPGR